MITARTSKAGMVVAAPCCPLSRLPCEWLGHTILLLTAILNSTPPPPPLTTTSGFRSGRGRSRGGGSGRGG
eukprot:scaffold8_cov127-Isochrysis_galbana.AAC.1